MLWRHRYAHIRYAFALGCRPGAVQKTTQFRTFRREVPFATISSVYDDPRLWGHVLRWGSALSYSDLAGCASHNFNLYVPQFRRRIILRWRDMQKLIIGAATMCVSMAERG